MKPPPSLALVALAVALAGCGDDGGYGGDDARTAEGAQQATGPAVEQVTVGETEYKLDPANTAIDQAGVIEFTAKNKGEAPHALAIETPQGGSETKELQPGESARLKVELEPGEYVWYCPVGDHKKRGMEGKITVAGAGEGDKQQGGGGARGGY